MRKRAGIRGVFLIVIIFILKRDRTDLVGEASVRMLKEWSP